MTDRRHKVKKPNATFYTDVSSGMADLKIEGNLIELFNMYLTLATAKRVHKQLGRMISYLEGRKNDRY